MKTNILQQIKLGSIFLIMALSINNLSFAQPNILHWKLGGNPPGGIDAVDPTNNILGTIPNFPLRFITNNTERFRITNDGALLASGTSGAIPASGAGTRLMWIPSLNAFRAGRVLGIEWDPVNIGINSFAAGFNTIARGFRSTAFGDETIASGNAATALGNYTIASANSSTALGFYTTASGGESVAMGSGTTASGMASFAMGMTTTASGQASIAMGTGTIASANFSISIGARSEANGLLSCALGTKVIADNVGSYVIGHVDTSSAFFLVNNIPRTLMIGFNSDIPTLFVTPSTGVGTTGRVGIGTGNTADVISKLTVFDNQLPAMSVFDGSAKFELAVATSPGFYSNISTTGDAVIRANGGSTEDFILAIRNNNNGAFRFTTGNFITESEKMTLLSNGNLGINTTTPTQRLDINGLARIRELPLPANQDETLNKMVVTDDNGVLQWRDVNNLPAGDFDWEVSGSNVITGHPNVFGFPTGLVSIGRAFPFPGGAKLNVFDDDQIGTAGEFIATGTGILTADWVGIKGRAEGTDPFGYNINIGVIGQGRGIGFGENIGVEGEGIGASAANGGTNVGVQAEARNGFINIGLRTNVPASDIAIQVPAGDCQKPLGGAWSVYSDKRLKTNMSSYTDGMSIIKQLNPVFYEYNGKAAMPTGIVGIGLVGQDLQQIAPYAVDTFYAKMDSSDATVTALLTSNSGPLLFAAINAIKELDSLNTSKDEAIEALEARLDQLEELIMQCCSGSSGKTGSSGSNDNSIGNNPSNTLNQNYPNPFMQSTNISYQLQNAGDIELNIYSQQTGAHVATLFSGFQDAGDYSIDWSTDDIPAGIYVYTLQMDGKVLVKKAVHVK